MKPHITITRIDIEYHRKLFDNLLDRKPEIKQLVKEAKQHIKNK